MPRPRGRGTRGAAGSLFAPPGAQANPLTRPLYLPIRRREQVPLVGTPVVSASAYTPRINPAYYRYKPPATGPFTGAGWAPYLPLVSKPDATPAATGTLAERGIYLPITMRDDQGQVVSSLTGLPAGGVGGGWPATAPPTLPGMGGAGTSRGWQVPPGIDPGWYGQFQKEHGGETPEDFYGRNREGLAEALADREWSQGFAQMYGRAPSEDDWKAWYFHTRGGPGMTQDERRAARIARKGGARKKLPRFRGKKKKDEQRPPLYQPPQIFWR